jgi:hypothetical protein
MWPSTLPDSVGKTILFFGLVLIFFGSYQDMKYDDKLDLNSNKIEMLQDSVDYLIIRTETLKEDLIDQSKSLSQKYNIKNPISFTDSTTSFIKVLSGSSDGIKVTNLLIPLWLKYYKSDRPIRNFEKTINSLIERNNSINRIRGSWNYFNGWLIVFGSLFILSALVDFSVEETYKHSILKTEVFKRLL